MHRFACAYKAWGESTVTNGPFGAARMMNRPLCSSALPEHDLCACEYGAKSLMFACPCKADLCGSLDFQLISQHTRFMLAQVRTASTRSRLHHIFPDYRQDFGAWHNVPSTYQLKFPLSSLDCLSFSQCTAHRKHTRKPTGKYYVCRSHCSRQHRSASSGSSPLFWQMLPMSRQHYIYLGTEGLCSYLRCLSQEYKVSTDPEFPHLELLLLCVVPGTSWALQEASASTYILSLFGKSYRLGPQVISASRTGLCTTPNGLGL